MRSNQHRRRRLQVRRETVRRLSALSERQLTRVAGGTDDGGGVDPTFSANCWDDDSVVMSKGSRYC